MTALVSHLKLLEAESIHLPRGRGAIPRAGAALFHRQGFDGAVASRA